jgi:hypothetical protein
MVKEKVGAGVAGIVGILLITQISGVAANYIVQADSNEEWNNEIVDADSSDYLVENDSVYLQSDTAVVHTQEVDVSGNSNVSINVDQLTGNTTVTVYDGSDTSLTTGDLTGEQSFSYDLSDSVDTYYLEITSNQVDDSRIDEYNSKEPSDELIGWLEIMVIGMLGAVVLLMFG